MFDDQGSMFYDLWNAEI